MGCSARELCVETLAVSSETHLITRCVMVPFEAPPGFAWVFCKSFRHYRTGKPVFRKNGGYFRFLVRRRKK